MNCYFCKHEIELRNDFTYQYCDRCEAIPGIKFAATSVDGFLCFIKFYHNKIFYTWFIDFYNNKSELRLADYLGKPPIITLPFTLNPDIKTIVEKTQLYLTFS